MKTFKTLAATLCLATAAFAATPAQASIGFNGAVLNGLSTNGLSTNGLSTNGLSTNGLSTNGLSTNGLSTNGLSTNGTADTGIKVGTPIAVTLPEDSSGKQ